MICNVFVADVGRDVAVEKGAVKSLLKGPFVQNQPVDGQLLLCKYEFVPSAMSHNNNMIAPTVGRWIKGTGGDVQCPKPHTRREGGLDLLIMMLNTAETFFFGQT